MENSRLFERVRDLSIRDGLTTSSTTATPWSCCANEFERVVRYDGGFSVLMVDIDHFKSVNDEHGHPAGDAVLREVARVLEESLRTVDAVGRYGGEEFVVLLPHTSPEEAMQTAERVRATGAAHVFRVRGKPLRVTVSVGVATAPRGRRHRRGAHPRGRQGALPGQEGRARPDGLARAAVSAPRSSGGGSA